MSDRESDIEFDFFEEPDTRETEERPRRRGPRPPVRPPTGLTPLLRLVGLISFAILIVLLLVVWIDGCREDQRKETYRDYVETVSDYATDSQRLGRRFNSLLTTRGTQQSEVENELSGLAQEQEAIANSARGLEPPGRLRQQHSHLLDALDLRTNGLEGMNEAFKSTASSRNANRAGAELALQMKRFVTSDVIWEDLFKEPTRLELNSLDITGVNVPDSMFLPNSDIATTASMKAVWQRIHGASTGGASCEPRGTGIVSTKVLPSGRELSTESTNTIQLTTELAFAVTIRNSGCAQEVGLRVQITIQSPTPITARRTVTLINPGEEATVEFRDLGLPPLDQRTSLTVEVDPVPNESNTNNNAANYPVQFAVQ
jgi:hypothetical protein